MGLLPCLWQAQDFFESHVSLCRRPIFGVQAKCTRITSPSSCAYTSTDNSHRLSRLVVAVIIWGWIMIIGRRWHLHPVEAAC